MRQETRYVPIISILFFFQLLVGKLNGLTIFAKEIIIILIAIFQFFIFYNAFKRGLASKATFFVWLLVSVVSVIIIAALFIFKAEL